MNGAINDSPQADVPLGRAPHGTKRARSLCPMVVHVSRSYLQHLGVKLINQEFKLFNDIIKHRITNMRYKLCIS